MEDIYCIFALIILLNMIQMQYLIKMRFCSKCCFFMKPTYIQVLIKKNKFFLLLLLFESRRSDLYFDVLHIQILIQQNILGAMKFY